MGGEGGQHLPENAVLELMEENRERKKREDLARPGGPFTAEERIFLNEKGG